MQESVTKCTNCGGKLEFAPGQNALKCPYCQTENKIQNTGKPIVQEEIDFESALASFDSMATEEIRIVPCTSCGSENTFSPNVTSGSCDFCGINLMATGETSKAMKPQYLIPFQITKEESAKRFKQWIQKRWFAPSALKKMASVSEPLKGIYYPFWTFDSQTDSRYTGERGEHYTVQVEQKDANGNLVTREETRTRWYPANGFVSRFFNDVLITASRSLPEDLTGRLQQWKLTELTAVQPAYLSGFKAESYSVGLRDGYSEAQKIMNRTIHQDVIHDIGGDEQRVHGIQTKFSAITFKYILLPVWTMVYRFKQKSYQVLVNGQTGEIQGKRPYSAAKILAAIFGCAAIAALVWFVLHLLKT